MNTPLEFYKDDKSLSYYIFDVGEGLMILLIFPDQTVMLFDSNITNDNSEKLIEKLSKYIPEKYDEELKKTHQYIDIFVNSHRDEDHYRGLKHINNEFPIKAIWDSGQSGATTDSDDYKYYMTLRRVLKNKDEKNLLVPVPSNECIVEFGKAKVFCLATSKDYQENYICEQRARLQHTNSMVLYIRYSDVNLLLTGDSDWKSWKEKIVPNFEKHDLIKSNILVASHHGSRSFFTDETVNDIIDSEENPENTYIESIEKILPTVTLISCGNYETAHHPNNCAMKLYNENTKNSQVYTTKNLGTICGFINEDNFYGIVPDRFIHSSNTSSIIGFDLECNKIIDNINYPVRNGEKLKIGCNLMFKANTRGGLIEPIDDLQVFWEVSNSGKYEHSDHQEIYKKDPNEVETKLNFSRDLSYKGKHLLRCRIKNRKYKYDVTNIFVVEGI